MSKRKKTKILICHNYYRIRGGEYQVVEQERALLEQCGHTVILYSRDSRETNRYGWMDRAICLLGTLFSYRTYREVLALIRRENPDVAHVHNVFPLLSISLYLALLRSGTPIVQTVHNFRFLCPNGLFLRDGSICELCKDKDFRFAVRYKCYRSSYVLSAMYSAAIKCFWMLRIPNRISCFIALSQFAKEKLIEGGIEQERIIIKPNFIEHIPKVIPQGKDRNDPYFIFLGRLSQEKGILTLLKAFQKVSEAQTIGLKILGTGPLEASAREYVDASNLPNVEFCGFVGGNQKFDLLSGALATVLCSECYENFPLTILESFAAGVPVIASRIGGIPSIVSEGDGGILFSPGSVDDLAEKMLYLIRFPQLAYEMGLNAQSKFAGLYSRELNYRKLLTIYDAALMSRKGLEFH